MYLMDFAMVCDFRKTSAERSEYTVYVCCAEPFTSSVHYRHSPGWGRAKSVLRKSY